MSAKINHIALLIDRSLSTQGIAQRIIQQFNSEVSHIREQAGRFGQKTHLSLYTFSDEADRPLLFEVPLDLVDVKPLTSAAYNIEGYTAMLDSVKMAIDDLSQFHHRKSADDHSFLVIAFTDGEENRSKVTRDAFRQLMQEKVASDIWTFTFSVPKGYKRNLVNEFGIPDGNVMEWDTASRSGVEDYGRATSTGITNYFTARQQGRRSVRSFFSTDLSAVTMRDVNRTLEEVTTLFSKTFVRPQQNGVAIRDFCEREVLGRRVDYLQGNAFYELTKPETVQIHKKVVVENRASGKLYGGPSARAMLNLPVDGEIRVRPGDHGNFKIYVQSTSVNRKLVGGTTLLYLKDRAATAW